MLTLLQTLVDIIRFRKGPDAIPHSMALFVIVVGLWLFVDLLGELVIPDLGTTSISGLVVSVIGLGLFGVIVALDRKNERLLQMMTALVGCGAVLGMVLTLVIAVMLRFQEISAIAVLGLMTVWAITLFSILVDGHILSRTLERPRLYGVILAFFIFAVQYYLSTALNPAQTTAA